MDIIPVLENHMQKNMDNDMATGIIAWFSRFLTIGYEGSRV